MSRVKTEKLHDFLVSKEMKYNVRLTTFTHGQLKKMFLADCIQREWPESTMMRHIIETYYSISSNRPTLTEKQMDYFKKILLERLEETERKRSGQSKFEFPDDDKTDIN